MNFFISALPLGLSARSSPKQATSVPDIKVLFSFDKIEIASDSRKKIRRSGQLLDAASLRAKRVARLGVCQGTKGQAVKG
jgi:hypothetical protein